MDTTLCDFIDKWNATYSSPQLTLANLDELFGAYQQKFARNPFFFTGEISPYWEDGAYSTAAEEIQNRSLSAKTIALEKQAKKDGSYERLKTDFYQLHRNIILFHEHTWGAWCSISDPHSEFTTEQWRIKKAFLDSAQAQFNRLEQMVTKPETATIRKGGTPILDFRVDLQHGGITALKFPDETLAIRQDIKLFEGIYVLGINPAEQLRMQNISMKELSNTASEKVVEVRGNVGSISSAIITYRLDKQLNQLQAHVRLEKSEEQRKESFHFSLNPTAEPFTFIYGSDAQRKTVPEDQLAGSNREFVCTEDYVEINSKYRFSFYTPQVNLIETNGIINENITNGVKTWEKEKRTPSSIFLYVFNNYWHTNYKATQAGTIEFDVILVVD